MRTKSETFARDCWKTKKLPKQNVALVFRLFIPTFEESDGIFVLGVIFFLPSFSVLTSKFLTEFYTSSEFYNCPELNFKGIQLEFVKLYGLKIAILG